MRFGFDETCLDHDPGPRHPESPDRLRAVKRGLSKRHGVTYEGASPANEADAMAVHTDGYVREIREFCESGGGNWDPDTAASEATWPAALASAGLAMDAARAALNGADGRNTPFSLGRPPGHHAVEDDAMGFCFLNNAAVAAQYAIDDLGVDRVAIFDWDVHHGNGTQDIFYDRGDVFYASIHEDGLYPGTGEADETGEGDGEGATLNLPYPAGSGDAEYCAGMDELIAPAIEAFDPDLLVVSAGFDAHRHDPISRMHVSTEGYSLLTDRVRTLADDADAALAFVLEGGYSLDTLADGVGAVHETFDGRDPVGLDDEPSDAVSDLIEEVAESHQGVGSK
ncbi:histone deacetylase family protein [Halobacterium litoreum]|uniref:Histone deacetylase family protein n=1 Tax=Halobacterium litoreum TaxID=2039234 RepID=A0ABD5NGC1_9EURY|nr:histone deacetylase [Halobacterium litoreum]UHH12929.1 histone deacetylase [Halobacterium litoreum]